MRIVIADDAAVLREGLARVLTEARVDVVGQVGTSAELLAVVSELQPDVAIVDIRMPPTWTDEGLVAAEEIRRRFPDVGVLLLSQYIEAQYALKMLDSSEGRVGYLLKDRVLDVDELVASLERIATGETVIEPALVAQLVERSRVDSPIDELTPRELEVLSLMAEGLTDRGISERLYVTLNTVETHIRHILGKLDLPATPADNRRVQAVLAYMRSH